MPLELLKAKNISGSAEALRKQLLDRHSSFGKEYLRLLVREIRVKDDEITITGSHAALAGAMAERDLGTLG